MLDPHSSEPLYLQMANLLRQMIQGGELKAGDKLDPELVLSRQHSLSRGTVRDALDLLEKEGFLRRIQGKGTFVQTKEAPQKSSIIGVIMPYVKDPMIMRILMGMEHGLHDRGYNYILCHSNSELELERKQLERLKRQGTAGVVLFPSSLQGERDMIVELFGEGFPFVLVDRRIEGLHADFVGIDNYEGAFMAVSTLLDAGHEGIACIVPPDRPTTIVERIRGYEAAMFARGLFPLAAVSLAGSGPSGSDGIPSYTAEDLAPLDRLMRLKNRPTALFCGNDFIAIGLMRHLRQQGFSIPEDVSVFGFDNTAYASFPDIQLSTISQPSTRIGEIAADYITQRIDDRSLAPRATMLHGEVVARNSCAELK